MFTDGELSTVFCFYFEIHRIKSTINIVDLPALLKLATYYWTF